MSDADRLKLKEHIKSDIVLVREELLDLELKLEPIAPDCSLGRLSRSEAMIEQEVSAEGYRLASIRLNKLLYAQSRVDSDAYGVCEICEEDIVLGRLFIMPEATRCAKCAD